MNRIDVFLSVQNEICHSLNLHDADFFLDMVTNKEIPHIEFLIEIRFFRINTFLCLTQIVVV